MQNRLNADLPPGWRPPDADPPMDADTPDTEPPTPRRQTVLNPYPLDADPTGHVTCDACWEANSPSCEQNDTQV